MPTQIFVNLPVADLKRSMDFYTRVGFTNNPQFTDDTAACMVLSESIYVMLLTHEKFKGFTPKTIADATKVTEVLLAISCDTREEVGQKVQTALAAGGTTYAEPNDLGFMLQHGFQDPDGHIWEVFHMDMSAMPTE